MQPLPNRPLRILILAYYFPPLNSIASHRPYSWAAAWAGAGHEVHVLTTEKYAFDGTLDLEYDLSGFTVHAVSYLDRAPRAAARPGAQARAQAQRWDRLKLATRRVRLGMGMFGEIALLAWRPLLRRALELQRERRFDFVITTSPPEVVHFVGHALSRRAGLPWVADYRDLWFHEMRLYQFRLASWLTGLVKRPRLRDAAALSTVSQGLADRLREFLGREAIVCYNGFMPQPVPPGEARPWSDGRLHIAYTGRMFPGKRDPGPFLAGLRRALDADPAIAGRVAVDFYGYADDWVRESIGRHGLGDAVAMHGLVSYARSMQIQRHADLLLFLDWMDDRAEGILTGKLFEYLGAGRPILCVGTRRETEAARIIERAGAGVVACSPEEVAEAVARLAAGRLAVPGAAPERVAMFSRYRQADALLAGIRERVG